MSDALELRMLFKNIVAELKVLGIEVEQASDLERIKRIINLVDELEQKLIHSSDEQNSHEQNSDDQKSLLTQQNEIFSMSYISQSNINEDDVNREMDSILRKSQCRNKHYHVTGYLIYRSGYFLQYLEGPLSSLEYIYSKIAMDQRHGKINLLHKNQIFDRNFKNWSMSSYVANTKEDLSFSADFIQKAAHTSHRLSSQEVISLINFFKYFSNK